MRAYFARAPYENVMLEWVLSHDRSSYTRDRFYVVRDQEAAVAGVAYFGRQTLLSAKSDAAVEALGKIAYIHRDERAIVGERSCVRRYWECVRAWHTPPRIVRERQPLFALERGSLVVPEKTAVHVRRAHASEVALVLENSAQMIEGELGYDPRTQSGDFEWNVRRMIERGWWWIGFSGKNAVFFCHLGPYGEATAQLQGVWTVPNRRQSTLATQALALVCRELLREFPTLSLYVNDFNEAAIRLYLRVGFTEVAALSTYMF